MRHKRGHYLTAAAPSGGAAAAAPAERIFEPSLDRRRDGSAFFRTVFILDKTFPIPFFSCSPGTDGPPCAGELMPAAGFGVAFVSAVQ